MYGRGHYIETVQAIFQQGLHQISIAVLAIVKTPSEANHFLKGSHQQGSRTAGGVYNSQTLQIIQVEITIGPQRVLRIES